jgi:hypothetical protein
MYGQTDLDFLEGMGEENIDEFGVDAFTKDWSFTLDQVKIPVSIFQGDEDLMVPGALGRASRLLLVRSGRNLQFPFGFTLSDP